jgi:outer membrane protein TolC
MRSKSPISACVRFVAAFGVALGLFASGPSVSASGQQPPAQTPQTAQPKPLDASAAPNVLRISADDAVKMALENNLGLRADRLGPQIETYGVASARAAYGFTLGSSTTTRSSTAPSDNFITGASSTLTNESFRTQGGLGQLLPWGGGRYQIGLDGGRLTTSDATSVYNPRLDSNFFLSYTQPLLRNFTIDATKQTLLQSKNRQQIADLQLRQAVTQTSRDVRFAYFNLVNAIGQHEVAQKSLELARTSLRNNERRVEVGSMAPIELIQAQAEVASTEEQVIIAEGQIQSAEDNLRLLIMNPSQPDYWTTKLEPAERPTLTPQPIDVEAAIANALANRTDLAQARKQIESTDVTLKYLRNQKLPAIDMVTQYSAVGYAGTQREFDRSTGIPIVIAQSERAFRGALGDVFANDFKTWSFRFDISYPIGTSSADANAAQARLQREQQTTNLRDLETRIVATVRDAARQVSTSLKRVESTQKARELAEQNLQAEEKRLAVGMSDSFRLFQAQRDLTRQLNNELNAIIAYNRALINFEAVQTVPLGGGGGGF